MFGDADRSHARAAAAVRNAEGLVQVQMAGIRADVGGTAKTYLGVQVRPIHIDLPPELVDDFTDLFDALLEHAVRGRISNHQAG